MDNFNKTVFKDLASVHQPHCVSIYMTTHQAGGPEGIKKDRITFKNLLQEASARLNFFELSDNQIKDYLKPAYDLLENESMWSHLSDGLILYLYDTEIKVFQVPVELEAQIHVGSSLYLLPAIPLLTDAGRHFILALSLNHTRLFEATRHSVIEKKLPAEFPGGLEDAVGEDYEQASLQFRSGQGEGPDAAMYHGHGSGAMTEKKKEIAKYFREIDHEINEILSGEKEPLVLACVDYLFPIYKSNNSYQALESKFIKGNHDTTDMKILQEESWKLIGDRFDKKREESIKKFEENLNAGVSSFNKEQVIPAAMIGKVETLFVKKGSQVFGHYNPKENTIETDAMSRIGNADLINQAAVETVSHGGKVILLEENNMPEEMGDVAANYRYSL